MSTKLWIARDKQGWLQLYLGKPCFRLKYLVEDWDGTFMGYLPKENFPEVTFENSPQEIELKLISNDKETKSRDRD